MEFECVGYVCWESVISCEGQIGLAVVCTNYFWNDKKDNWSYWDTPYCAYAL